MNDAAVLERSHRSFRCRKADGSLPSPALRPSAWLRFSSARYPISRRDARLSQPKHACCRTKGFASNRRPPVLPRTNRPQDPDRSRPGPNHRSPTTPSLPALGSRSLPPNRCQNMFASDPKPFLLGECASYLNVWFGAWTELQRTRQPRERPALLLDGVAAPSPSGQTSSRMSTTSFADDRSRYADHPLRGEFTNGKRRRPPNG